MQSVIRSIFILFSLGFFTVASAQLPPEIRADAYLLQAEQAIRNGDTFRAQAAIQNILRLQKEHELDLSDEFHFRYAKAADAVDLSEQALEAVLKYLAVSGREGQHYLDALAVMNKVQMAVSCKGWDTEDYFKTAPLEEVTACLDTGVDLKARDDAGATPLHRAVKNTENLDVIQALLNAGADIEAQDYNGKKTPLHYAVLNKNTDIIEILLNAGADIEGSMKISTPLHVAARYNKNPDILKVLIDASADPNARDKDKNTPLHYAAAYNKNPDILKVLIDAGANLEAQNKENWTPLHSAAASNVVHYLLHRPTEYNTASKNPDVIKVLIDAGANLEAQTIYGFTPLLLAAQSKNPGVIKVLIDAGANLEAQDNRGKMALKLATEGWGKENESAAVKVLIDAGARESQEGDGFGKAAAALLGGAAIMYAGKDAEDQEAVTETVREYMEDVLSGQPDGNINSATPPSQSQGGQAQDPMQQALLNLEKVCGEKYQGNFAVDDHARFFCLAAFNDYCALKRAKSSEAISKLRASLQQNCAALKKDGLESKCPYCK